MTTESTKQELDDVRKALEAIITKRINKGNGDDSIEDFEKIDEMIIKIQNKLK